MNIDDLKNIHVTLVNDVETHNLTQEYITGIIGLHKIIFGTFTSSLKLNISTLIKVKWISENIIGDKVVIDLGASYGYYEMIFNNFLDIYSLIIAVEPERNNYKSILGAMQYIRIPTIVVHGAISNELGTQDLYVHECYDRHSLFSTEPEQAGKVIDKVSVNTYTIDLLTTHLKKVDFIKIDIEGYDEKALHGAHKTLDLNEDMAIMMEVHSERFGVDEKFIFDFLINKGFKIYDINNCLRFIDNSTDMSSEILALKGNYNEKLNTH